MLIIRDDTPDSEDIFLSDTGYLGSQTSVSAGRKHLGIFNSSEDAEKAIFNWIGKHNYRPNIWQISDHGNVHPYDLSIC